MEAAIWTTFGGGNGDNVWRLLWRQFNLDSACMWQSKKVFKPEEQVGGPPEKLNRLSACMWHSQKLFKTEDRVGGPP
ncbi:hypothetical protein GDO81_030142 [Engystomops pustulosus]|uniref:Uncharacterized protein n=1 Tax=Engystomops pustulosus TaxID=76066 RepID=A0AAV6ZH05_ENGPU|nr:hypothetical protein GDO81_030142 [Engystomops pustulosus]